MVVRRAASQACRAQRFPEDYDGILAGDAGNDVFRTSLLWAGVRHQAGSLSSPLTSCRCFIKQRSKRATSSTMVPDPALAFNWASSLQAGGERMSHAAQAEAARDLAGPHNPRTGESIIAGLTPGSKDL
jgi:feruloyl esterase